MPIVVEDGTGKPNANAYVDAAGARQYASDRGIALPDVQGEVDPVEPWLVLATDYLESLSYIFIPATTTQALAWPRKVSNSATDYVMSDKLAKAQCQLVIEQSKGIELMPTTAGGDGGKFVTREKVDVIETTYSETLGTLATPTMPAVNALLRDLLIRGGGSFSLRTVRV
jgi:hypothetical protein